MNFCPLSAICFASYVGSPSAALRKATLAPSCPADNCYRIGSALLARFPIIKLCEKVKEFIEHTMFVVPGFAVPPLDEKLPEASLVGAEERLFGACGLFDGLR